MSQTPAMPTWERAANYARTRSRPTPRQRRRIIHKDRRQRSEQAKLRVEAIIRGAR